MRRSSKSLMIATTTLFASFSPVLAKDTLTIASWGGAFQDAQREAWFKLVEEELNITIKEDTTSGIADVRVQVASGNPTWDLAQQGNYNCAILEKEGNAEPLNDAILNMEGFDPTMKGKAWISNLTYAAVLAYNSETYGDKKPKTWADMWDQENFPGPRSLRKSAVYALEAALLADGVNKDELYPLDVERAFKKLESLRENVAVWWSSGAQSAQVLQDGEVEMAGIWNGRVEAIATNGTPVEYSYDQQMILTDCWVIPKGAKNKDLALKAIEIMSRPEVQARLPLYMNYGPANSKAFETGVIPEDVAKRLPSHPDNAPKGFVLDANYWAENLDTLTQRLDLFIQN